MVCAALAFSIRTCVFVLLHLGIMPVLTTDPTDAAIFSHDELPSELPSLA